MYFFLFSYRPFEHPLIEPIEEVIQPVYVQLFQPSQPYPTMLTAKIVKYSVTWIGKFLFNKLNKYFFFSFIIIAIGGFIICAIQIFAGRQIVHGDPATLTFFILFIVIEVVVAIIIAKQPQNKKSFYFEVYFYFCVL